MAIRQAGGGGWILNGQTAIITGINEKSRIYREATGWPCDWRHVMKPKGCIFDPRNSSRVLIHSYLYCEVSSNKMVNDDLHVLSLHQLNYSKCSLSETLISAMDDINTALIVFPCSFQLAILLHFTFLNPGIKHPGSSCICSLLSRKESRRVGVIQTFFKLQFIFSEL